jgi:hypothetical protein
MTLNYFSPWSSNGKEKSSDVILHSGFPSFPGVGKMDEHFASCLLSAINQTLKVR